MKRRIESRLEWDFCYYGTKPGLVTNLTPSEEDPVRGPLFVKSTSVQSITHLHRVSGHLRVHLDRRYDWAESQGGPFGGTYLTLFALSSRLCGEKLMSGCTGLGGDGFTMEFNLESGHIGFCEEALKRVLVILEGLGVKKEEIIAPKVTQRTLVWVPEAHPLRGRHCHNHGWIEYGTFLGDLYGLSSTA